MTAQIHDRVRWKGSEYSVVGIQGHGLFDPGDHGLQTMPTTTANWRGWVAIYGIDDDRLRLLTLNDVGLSAEQIDDPPEIEGVKPRSEGRVTFIYEGLDLALPFSGRLLIANGFIQSLYRHMGFHPAWKFEESWEIDFEGGRVTNARDISEEMRMVRDKMRSGALTDPDGNTPNWIARTFHLSFGRSKGEAK